MNSNFFLSKSSNSKDCTLAILSKLSAKNYTDESVKRIVILQNAHSKILHFFRNSSLLSLWKAASPTMTSRMECDN